TIPCRIVVENPRNVTTRRNKEPKVNSNTPKSESKSNDSAQVLRPSSLVGGMFVSVSIVAGDRSSYLGLPENATRPGNQVWRVKTVAADAKAPAKKDKKDKQPETVLDIVPVEVVQINGEHVIIRADTTTLRPGDRLITTPLGFVYPNMPIQEE